MKLHIDAPTITDDGLYSELSAVIHFDGWENKKKRIWYRVENKFRDYLCDERGDAFLIALLPFALSHSKTEDIMIIESDAPISERLFYQLKVHFIPTLVKCVSWCDAIVIDALLTNKKLPSLNAVGTGISGGIDSFYTLLKSLKEDPKNYKVTHGLYCENEYNGDFKAQLQNLYRDLAKNICKEINIEFVDIQSNICTCLYDLVHEIVVTSVYLSYAYALEKMFNVYYFSASHLYEAFEFVDYSSEYYALFNMYCMSSENIELYVTGADAIRHEKTSYIADFETPRKHLMVCRNPQVVDGKIKNCSRCSKCTRTMIDLDLWEKLDSFNEIFDVGYYRKNPNYFWGYLFFKGKKDAFIKETLEYAKSQNIHIPLSAKIAGIIKIVKNKGNRGNPLQTEYRP